MPLTVTFILVASLPLILIPVYPIPLPASDVEYVDGVEFNRNGMSFPELFFSMKSLEILENE